MPQLTSAEVRATLVDALQLDLVGPKPDDTEHAEEILTQAPSKWYLTGFLAPFGAKPDDRSDDDSDNELEEVGASESSEDSQSPEKSPARKALFPSSMGLSFLISHQTKELQVTAHWGDYLPIELAPELESDRPESQTLDPQAPEGKPLEDKQLEDKQQKPEGWQRIPQTANLSVAIGAEDSFETEIPGGSGLTIVVNCRPVRDRRFEPGTLSVSIFLVNYRQIQFSDKDTTFAFQTSLTVQCQEGFIPRSDLRGVDSDDWDETVASLQYRHDYEFAVGHNVSAIAQNTDQADCTQVCTTWIPAATVPRVVAAPIKDVKLGMEALANAESAEVIQQRLSKPPVG